MWRGSLRHPRKQQGKWQVSQVRLAHDIANTTIALEPLDRYVSRSRRQSVFEAAQADLQRRYAVVDGQRSADGPDLIDPLLDLGWEDAFLPEEDEVLDPSLDENDDASLDTRNTAEPISAEERAIAFVQYDKTLEARRRNKPFMERIWRAAGWEAGRQSFAMRRACGVMRCARLDCPLMSGATSWDKLPNQMMQPRPVPQLPRR